GAVVGRECASQQRFDAKRLEIILSDESAAGGLRAASGCDPQVAEVRASKEGGKYPVVVSKFAIKGIGEYIRPRRSRAPGMNAGGIAHGYKLPWVLYGQGAQHDRINHRSEERRVGKECGDREAPDDYRRKSR